MARDNMGNLSIHPWVHPLEGLDSEEPCGEIHPTIPTFLQKNKNLSVVAIDDLLKQTVRS